MMPRTRLGTDLLEKSGAIANSGDTRARTAKKPSSVPSWIPRAAKSSWGVIRR